MDIYLKFAHPSHSNEFQTDQHSQVCPKGPCCNRHLTPTKEQEQDIPVSMVPIPSKVIKNSGSILPSGAGIKSTTMKTGAELAPRNPQIHSPYWG